MRTNKRATKPTPQRERSLKIKPRHRRLFVKKDYKYRSTVVPEIRFSGEWRRRAGFDCERVRITYVPNMIMITPME